MSKPQLASRGAPARTLLNIPITAIMADALTQMERMELRHFRVGYSNDSCRTIVHRGTIEGLWKRGLADYHSLRGVSLAYVTREGRAALARWRAANPPIAAEIVERFL